MIQGNGPLRGGRRASPISCAAARYSMAPGLARREPGWGGAAMKAPGQRKKGRARMSHAVPSGTKT